MKYLPIFNKGDKVTVNNKYIGLKSMVGEIYTIRAGPARCSDTWCYWLENVAGGIAADALEPLEQTNEEWRKSCSTEEFAEALTKVVLNIVSWNNDPKPSEVRHILKSWLKQPHLTSK